MANKLFQQAREAVLEATQNPDCGCSVKKAQNALSSAYANSTEAEQRQLREMQNQLSESATCNCK